MKRLISFSLLLLSFESLAATTYYKGKVQRFSLDGTKPLGPGADSLASRVVGSDSITECVFLDGKVIMTWLQRKSGLVYGVSGRSFHGTVTFKDHQQTAWTYDFAIGGANAKITGTGEITPAGEMKNVKIWNQQAQIKEEYKPISESEFNSQKPKDLECR